MRVSLRLIFSLVVGVTILSLPFAVFQTKREKRALRRDLENRAVITGESSGPSKMLPCARSALSI